MVSSSEMARKREKKQPRAKNAEKSVVGIIRAVRQRHDTGCAIACAAMLAGVSYDEALRAIHGRKKPRKKSATIPKVRKGLKQLGVKTEETGRFMQLKRPAMMMFEWPCAPGLHHCVVYDPSFGGRIIDPAGDAEWYRGRDYYLRAWRRSGRMSVAVTQPRKRGGAR